MNKVFDVFVLAAAIVYICTPKAIGIPVRMDVGKVIIDTDAGSDDAGAIFMAINSDSYSSNSSLDVIAITCVNGNTFVDNVVVNVLKTLQTANRLDIPVYRGASNSVLLTPPQDNYFGEDGFGDFEFPNPPDPDELLQSKHAVNALIDTVNQYPGEVTLLCLGPLTNVALALRLDPLFLTKLKNLIVMGGSVEGVGNVKPGIEFNFYMDPEAAFIVLNSTDTSAGVIQPIILLPWESVSGRNLISMDWRMNELGTLPSSEVWLLNQAERYHLGGDVLNWGCADCLAAAVTVSSSIIEDSATVYAYVSAEGTSGRGAVFVDYNGSEGISPNIKIVKNIDTELYKTMLLSTIGGIPPAQVEWRLSKGNSDPTRIHNGQYNF